MTHRYLYRRADQKFYEHPIELYEEFVPPTEEEWIEKLQSLILQRLEKWYRPGRKVLRDTHTKGLAAVRGEFTINEDLPDEYRVGLFSEPGRTYKVWARFSNLDVKVRPDIQKDIRALAIKLMCVPGEKLWPKGEACSTLDLVMMGNPTFFTRNLLHFYEFEKAVLGGKFAQLLFMLTHPRTLAATARYRQRSDGVANQRFFSQTPYEFGDRAVKYRLRPLQRIPRDIPRHPDPDYLRHWLAEDLSERYLQWDFGIQFQTHPATMPIEDAMVEWRASDSPFRSVGRFRILRQSFDSPEQMEFCENLSFNPWRTLAEHQPLGSVNRARLYIYKSVAKYRRSRNHVPVEEPTPDLELG